MPRAPYRRAMLVRTPEALSRASTARSQERSCRRDRRALYIISPRAAARDRLHERRAAAAREAGAQVISLVSRHIQERRRWGGGKGGD